MADGYKEFDDAEWKIGDTDGGGGGDNKYVDLTLNKANGGATNGASASGRNVATSANVVVCRTRTSRHRESVSARNPSPASPSTTIQAPSSSSSSSWPGPQPGR